MTAKNLKAHVGRLVTWSIQINNLGGFDNIKYLAWWAGLSSSVDKTLLSPQFIKNVTAGNLFGRRGGSGNINKLLKPITAENLQELRKFWRPIGEDSGYS